MSLISLMLVGLADLLTAGVAVPWWLYLLLLIVVLINIGTHIEDIIDTINDLF